MASLLSEILFETNGQGPPPSKDFVVTPKEVFRNCRGHFDYLERLPNKLLLKILSYISLQDIGHMSQTSNRFRKYDMIFFFFCYSDEIWEQAVPGHCDKIHEETEILAKIMGWKNIFEFYYKKGHASPA
ncbi:F-box only protein 36a [Labeo rohita]|uniref:F-box only protein 36a n=1 Tax=Labeo rohita TaxID=84645 RepID=UPI0021E22813|nr:F-box only protein 36a [Labeo rohita]